MRGARYQRGTRAVVNGDSINELIGEPPPLRFTRRGLLRLGFFASLATLAAGAIAALLRFLHHGDNAPPDYVDMPLSSMPKPGEMADHLILIPGATEALEAKIYIVNLRPGEGMLTAYAHTPGGLIVFSRKCPGEGCTLPWNPGYAWEANGITSVGAFRCPCRDGTAFTRAGVNIGGPATRNMDPIEISREWDTLRIYPKRVHKGTPPGTPPDPAMFVPSHT